MKLIAYIRGGIGDTWIAISALQKICEDNKINKFDRLVITDSCYYFRSNYPKEFETYNLDIIRKLTNNIIQVSPQMNNNFWLSKNNVPFDDTTDALSQEEADKYSNEFMFWRLPQLKQYVADLININLKRDNTIFVDCPFTECIMMWNFVENKYERVSNDRAKFEFKPNIIENEYLNQVIPKTVLIHIRKKEEGNAHTEEDTFYQKLITWCCEKGFNPILIGNEGDIYTGLYYDLRDSNRLSFEAMGWLIDKCDVFVGNDSGFSTIKLYQQQKDKLLIMNHNRFERSKWINHMLKKSNVLLLDAKEDNFEKITKAIGDYYAII